MNKPTTWETRVQVRSSKLEVHTRHRIEYNVGCMSGTWWWLFPNLPSQWGALDAEIKVPSGKNTELKRSPFTAWCRSVCSHTCYAYCQGFLPCLFLPFQSIHLHFFQNLSQFFLCWLWLTHGSSVGPQNKIGHPARGRFPC